MKHYYSKLQITKEEFEHINKLFDIEDLDDESYENQEMIKNLGACKDDVYGGFCFQFENGVEIDLTICSGGTNYFDDWTFYCEYGEDVADCAYSIEEDNVLYIEEDFYHCQFEII